jgi:hypothetical protein
MRLLRSILILVLAPAAGCYVYTPLGGGDVALSNRDIRARLAPEEEARLRDFTTGETRWIQGQVVEESRDSILVMVEVHHELKGDRIQVLYQRVQLARSGILDMEVRQLDRERSYLVTGGVVAAVTVVAIKAMSGGGSPSGTTPRPPPEEARIPLFKVSLPIGR